MLTWIMSVYHTTNPADFDKSKLKDRVKQTYLFQMTPLRFIFLTVFTTYEQLFVYYYIILRSTFANIIPLY